MEIMKNRFIKIQHYISGKQQEFLRIEKMYYIIKYLLFAKNYFRASGYPGPLSLYF